MPECYSDFAFIDAGFLRSILSSFFATGFRCVAFIVALETFNFV